MSADKVQEAVARLHGVRTVRKFMFVRELDALIAAVREDEKARCIAAVKAVPPHIIPTHDGLFAVTEAIRNA